MERLWHRLVDAGITDSISFSEARVVRMINLSSLIASISLLFFMVYNIVNGNFLLSAVEALTAPILLLPILLNHRHYFRAAMVMLAVPLHIFIGLVTFWLVPGRGLEYVHVVIIVGLLMIYGWRWPFFIFYLFNVAMFYAPQVLLKVYPDDRFTFYDPLAVLIPVVLVLKHFLNERNAFEAQLADQNKELLRLNKEKDQLVSIAAHDLRSPLNRIEGLLSIVKLSSDNLTAEQHDLIDKVSEVSREQNTLIRDILNIDALENSPNGQLTLRPVDIVSLIDEVLESFVVIARNKNIRLQTYYNTSFTAHAWGDPGALTQVYENLLSNAIKYSPPGRTVRVTLRQEDRLIRTAVEDEGPGLQPEDLPLLFRKFQKLSAQPTAGESSSGLGLSIVKRYVDAMNGHIYYESNSGRGATFVVCLEQAVTDTDNTSEDQPDSSR